MSDEQIRDDRPIDIDWQSPRWRGSDDRQGESEREHRFRDDSARAERGAIDRAGSVGQKRKREQPTDGDQT